MKKYYYEVNLDGQDAPAKILRLVGTGKRVLEVGCASGVQTRILKERQNCTVTGIEIDSNAAEEARKYCESVIVGDLETMNLDREIGDRRYEVITIADVLEHLSNPAGALDRLRKYLDKEGIIVASIPNVVHAGLILEMANGRFDYRKYGLLDDTHIRFFTLKNVYRLFDQCGLEITALDRVIRSVENSEFYSHPISGPELEMLKHIQSNNPEWQTYQFIVTAVPQTRESASKSLSHLENREHIKDLELTIQSLRKRMGGLESQLTWIESHPARRLYSKIRKIFSGTPS